MGPEDDPMRRQKHSFHRSRRHLRGGSSTAAALLAALLCGGAVVFIVAPFAPFWGLWDAVRSELACLTDVDTWYRLIGMPVD